MDFYSGKQPNLIGPIMKSTVCKIMKKPTINNSFLKFNTFIGNYLNFIKLLVLINHQISFLRRK